MEETKRGHLRIERMEKLPVKKKKRKKKIQKKEKICGSSRLFWAAGEQISICAQARHKLLKPTILRIMCLLKENLQINTCFSIFCLLKTLNFIYFFSKILFYFSLRIRVLV